MTNNTTTDLITQLSHPDGSLRREAALRLGATHDPAAGDALIERLRVEENSRVREDLTWAAVQHSEALMPRLLTMLSDPDPRARRIGAHVLSKVGDPARLPELLPLVDDADASVAIKAYRAVANTGRPEALGPLAGRLGDGDALQKDALTGAFHRFGSCPSVRSSRPWPTRTPTCARTPRTPSATSAPTRTPRPTPSTR